MKHLGIKTAAILLVAILMLSSGIMVFSKEEDDTTASNNASYNDSEVQIDKVVSKEKSENPVMDSMAENNTELVEEPITRSTENPIDEQNGEATEKLTAEPTQDAIEKPTAEPTQETTEKPTAEPTEETTEKPTVEPTQEAIENSIVEPTQEAIENSIAEPTQEAKAEPANEPVTGLRSVRITADVADIVYFGDLITLKGILSGYEDVDYTLQWQRDTGDGWGDIPGANEECYSFELSEQSIKYDFSLLVTAERKID